jgi:bifunctional UDP-N-acetylglucosamine pyrophosphorylase/glucosamine-1-phosphate N-acetyltransferase
MRDEATPAEFPKVLRQVNGRPLISYVVAALHEADITDVNLIVGFGADYVRQAMGDNRQYIVQNEQLGSGHAVSCARETLGNRTETAIIMCGDSPLFTAATISNLIEQHISSEATITLISATLDDPTGYGRIKRLPSGEISGIVEEKCANSEEKAIKEINGGAYAFDSEWLWANIDRIKRNEAGEFNLTDLVRIAVADNRKIEAVHASSEEVMGVNTPDDLKQVEEILRMRSGNTI